MKDDWENLTHAGNSVGDIDKLKSRYFNLNKRTKEKEVIFDAYTSRINKDVEPVRMQSELKLNTEQTKTRKN